MNTKKINLLKTASIILATFTIVFWGMFLILNNVLFDQNTTTQLQSTLLEGYKNTSNGLISVGSQESEDLQKGLALLGAGVAGIGFLGAGAGQGYAAGKASEAVGRNPEAEAKIRNMMIIGAAIAESSALYALVVSILLIFVV